MKLYFSIIIPHEDDQILESLDFPFALVSGSKYTSKTEIWRSLTRNTRSCKVDKIKQIARETQANFIHLKIDTALESKHWIQSITGCLSVSPLNPLWVEPKYSETKRRSDHSLATIIRGEKTYLKSQSIDFFPSVLELVIDISDDLKITDLNLHILNQLTATLNNLTRLPDCICFAYILEGLYEEGWDDGIQSFQLGTITNRIKRRPAAVTLMKTKFPGFYPFLLGPTKLLTEVKAALKRGSVDQKQYHFFQGQLYSGISFSPEITTDPRLRFHKELSLNIPFEDETAHDLEVLNLLKLFLIELKFFEKEKEDDLSDYPGVFLDPSGSVTAYLKSTYQELLDSNVIAPTDEDTGLLECPLPYFQKLLGVDSNQVLVYPEVLRGIEFIEERLITEYERLSEISSDTSQNIITAYENKSFGNYCDQFKIALELGLFAGDKQS